MKHWFRDGFATLILSAVAIKLLYDVFHFALLFEAILLGSLSAGILLLVTVRRRNQNLRGVKHEIPKVILTTLVVFNLMFFSLMMVDRSKSLYVIRWVGDCPNLSREDLLTEVRDELGQLDEKYLRIRIDEQIKRSLVKSSSSEELYLSLTGRIIYLVADGLSLGFGLDGWSAESLKDAQRCQL